MKYLNAFADHMPKSEWFSDFFARGAGYLTDNALGPMQIRMLKRFLTDAGLIEKRKTTPLFDIVRELGVNSEETWGIALANLANGNPQIAWYVTDMEVDRIYSSREVIDALAPHGVKEKDARSILKSFKRLCETQLGKRLKFGTSVDQGHALTFISRTKPVVPSPRVMLYALYRFAEACGDYREFTLTRLMDFSVKAEGVSPAQIFALSRSEMEAVLNGLAHSNPDFITFTTTHDLELVRLADDRTSADVLSLFHS